MDTRVEALIALFEDLERLERHLLTLVEANDACAIETRVHLADSWAQMDDRSVSPWLAPRSNKTFLR
jgi:hypothetical protein